MKRAFSHLEGLGDLIDRINLAVKRHVVGPFFLTLFPRSRFAVRRSAAEVAQRSDGRNET